MFRKMALTFVVIWLAASSSSSSAFAWPLLPVGYNQDWALPSTVVIIDAGHGGIDGEPHQLIF